MTEPESHDSTPDEEPRAEAPEPEPWTPERVTEWNAYYDLYVMLGALLLAFVVSANKINYSAVWTQLKAGQIIAAEGRPLTSDLFSYTMEGRRWVNLPWLFEVGHALLHKAAFDAVPTDPADPTASATQADQLAAGVLVGLNALVRTWTVLVLLGIRRPGPGRWWAAVCATLAVGAIVSPAGVALGGIAGPGMIAPGNWGLLLLGLELLLIHRTVNLGRRGAVFGLVPLFLLWANIDESFVFGLLVLAATVAGRLGSEEPKSGESLSLLRGLVILGGCVVVCLINPSIFRVFPATLSPLITLFRPAGGVVTIEQLSYFGKGIRQASQAGSAWVYLMLYYLVIVGIGLGSFLLNRKRFSLSRFLTYAVAAVLWGALIRFGPEFAPVFAATLALNGQEWYHDRFGTVGRLGRGWALWSIGGRAVTIVLIFLLVARGLTGWGKQYGESTFGFGYNPDDFAFEAADYLRTAPIQGAVLNTSLTQGDALVWRAYPQRKTYIDSRHLLFPPAVLDRLQETRRALSGDAVERWKPLLDEYKVNAVMIQEATSPNTYRRLMQSPNWIPFYDDGNVVLFGRTDAPATDLAYFQAHSIKDPERLAFRQEHPVPSPEGPPTPVSWMDRIFQNRSLARPQAHTETSKRWLQVINPESGAAEVPDPARCLLAIQEARTALSHKPDDWRAYRLLSIAYRDLVVQESALLMGLKLTPEDRAQLDRIEPQPGLLMNRFRQRATALNFAIQTTPPPASATAARELRALNGELFQLYLSVNFLDLARDRLRAALDERGTGKFPPEGDQNARKGAIAPDFSPQDRAQMERELAQLDDQVKKIKQQMDDLTTEQQAGPLQRANFALSQGAPGLALLELEEADRTGLNPAIVRPQLLDLYCDTGQPERAVELLSSGNIEDPALGGEPGVSTFRQGRVYSLLGNYEYAASLWQERAIPQLRFERGIGALSAGQMLIKGEAQPALNTLINIPGKIATQASWEYDLALCRLESGLSDLAAERFTKALTLAPTLAVRPIVAYYLEKLGKPVSPANVEEPKPAQAEKSKTAPTEEEKKPGDEKPKDVKAESKEAKDEKP
jgi:tetratricopeptide (TPR) repeat protein